jgi:hypothetical protein
MITLMGNYIRGILLTRLAILSLALSVILHQHFSSLALVDYQLILDDQLLLFELLILFMVVYPKRIYVIAFLAYLDYGHPPTYFLNHLIEILITHFAFIAIPIGLSLGLGTVIIIKLL